MDDVLLIGSHQYANLWCISQNKNSSALADAHTLAYNRFYVDLYLIVVIERCLTLP